MKKNNYHQNKDLIDNIILDAWGKIGKVEKIARILNHYEIKDNTGNLIEIGLTTQTGKEWTKDSCSAYARKTLNLPLKKIRRTRLQMEEFAKKAIEEYNHKKHRSQQQLIFSEIENPLPVYSPKINNSEQSLKKTEEKYCGIVNIANPYGLNYEYPKPQEKDSYISIPENFLKEELPQDNNFDFPEDNNFDFPEDNNFVYIENGDIITDSRYVAKAFGKEHKNVLTKIRELINEINENISNSFKNSTAKFQAVEFKNKNNQMKPMYKMNRNAATLLIMRFTGNLALKFQIEFIDKFNEMEEKIKSLYARPTTELSIRDQIILLSRDHLESEQKIIKQIEETKLNIKSEMISEINNVKSSINEIKNNLNKKEKGDNDRHNIFKSELKKIEYSERNAPQMSLEAKIRKIILTYVFYKTNNNPIQDDFLTAYDKLDDVCLYRLGYNIRVKLRRARLIDNKVTRFHIYKKLGITETVYDIVSEIFRIPEMEQNNDK